jgi:hypothetical protein
MKRRYVLDSTSIISCFPEIFQETPKISRESIRIIKTAMKDEDSHVLVIPSVVFVEIFDKWFRGDGLEGEEFRARFNAEIYGPVKTAPNVEIREVDVEILEKFLALHDPIVNLENHDKIVLATASVLNAALITSDRNLRRFNSRYSVVSEVLD